MTDRLLRRSALAVALVVVMTGCGPTTFGVGMQRILSSILFGQPAPPKPQALPTPQVPLPPIPFVPQEAPLPAVKDPCPPAPLGAPALRPSNVDVDAPAQNGTYRWLSEVQITQPNHLTTSPLTSSIGAHLIEQAAQEADFPANPLQGQPDHHFTYTEVGPDPYVRGWTQITDFAIQTYSPVNYNGALSQDNFDPNGGIDIVDIKRLDEKGKLVEEYNPAKNNNGEGLLVFALPLPAGNAGNSGLPTPDAPEPDHFSWEYAVADPVSQWTIQIAASELNSRVRVDACGTIVNGWTVEAKLFISKNDPATGLPYPNRLQQDWTYVVAPQYGGLIVQERLNGDAGNGATIAMFDQLASTDITPLPHSGTA